MQGTLFLYTRRSAGRAVRIFFSFRRPKTQRFSIGSSLSFPEVQSSHDTLQQPGRPDNVFNDVIVGTNNARRIPMTQLHYDRYGGRLSHRLRIQKGLYSRRMCFKCFSSCMEPIYLFILFFFLSSPPTLTTWIGWLTLRPLQII